MRAGKFLSLLAVPLLLLPQNFSAHADVCIMGDVNEDKVLSISDVLMIKNFASGQQKPTVRQSSLADVNGDGRVNENDVSALERQLKRFSDSVPKGCYISCGDSETRYFWFDENHGNFIIKDTGFGLNFNFSCSCGEITFNTGSSKNVEKAYISWSDDRHFVLKWKSGKAECFRYFGEKQPDYGQLITGHWRAESDSGTRHFSINGLSGFFSDMNGGKSVNFDYKTDGNIITFNMDGEKYPLSAVVTRDDDKHFTLEWSDGTVEKFSPDNDFRIIDGVTYINGILIANKTYALPPDYDPGGLLPEVQKDLDKMFEDAEKEGISLWEFSGYRNYQDQKEIYENYKAMYGQEKADTFSSRPGYSEHQTGMTLDVNCADDSFDGTPEAIWLAENCYKYGFIIRYPKGKQYITGYKYEPWHIRWIGRENAEKVYKSGLCLEEYLEIDSVYPDD